MDLSFNYQNTDLEEFVIKKADLILDLAGWITDKMNYVHRIKHGEKFWLTVLKRHFHICINKKHLFEKEDYKVPRYLIDIDAFGEPEKKHILMTVGAYLSKTLREKGSYDLWHSKLENHNSLCFGLRSKEIADDRKGVYVPEIYPALMKPNFKSRKRWKKVVRDEGNIFLKNVLKHLPVLYVELFQMHYKKIELIEPETKSFHCEHIGSFQSKLYVAKYVESGAQLFLYQRGCGWGETEFQPSKTTYAICTNYITYGWKRHPKDIPGKAYRLEKFKEEYFKFKIENTKEIDALLVLSISNEQLRKHYKTFVESFVSGINKKKYSKTLVRPRPRSKYINNSKEVQYINLLQSIRVDSGKQSMAEATAKSRLNVLVYTPATNLYECVIVQQPFVAYDMYENQSKIIAPYLTFFEEVGILHKKVEDLVQHLNSIQLEEWWEQVTSDSRFDEFARKFAGKQ